MEAYRFTDCRSTCSTAYYMVFFVKGIDAFKHNLMAHFLEMKFITLSAVHGNGPRIYMFRFQSVGIT